MFVDSGIWIALNYKRDQWHENALLFKKKIKTASKIYITDCIITETYNFLLRKVSTISAFKTFTMFLESPSIEILYNDRFTFEATTEILIKYPNLSLTDANIIFFCQLLEVDKILSFDGGFDVVPEIQRIH